MRLPRDGIVSRLYPSNSTSFRLKHANIVGLQEVFEDKTKVFLVMEL